MKLVLTVLVILLLLLVALPMGMGHMGDCPSCTPAESSFSLGLCAGILSLIVFRVLLTATRLLLPEEVHHMFLFARSVYRPPRFS